MWSIIFTHNIRRFLFPFQDKRTLKGCREASEAFQQAAGKFLKLFKFLRIYEEA